MTWLVGNPRFSLVVENRFWLVNGAGPIRPWSDFVGCDRVSRGWEQWGVSRTRLSWPMCWVLGAWFNMAKNVVLCAKFLWIKGVFYHGLCVIIYAGRIVTCLHWYLIRVIGRMTSLEWFSIWETSNNIINFNDVRKRLWKLVSMMMFSPCVFCVLPCVTSTFTVSKLARIIKQASRVGGCERVFTPVRWRQVRLSCIKWRSTFFLYFFVRPSFGRQFVIRVDGCCANCVVGLAFLPSGHTTRKQRHYDAITTSCARWVG